MLRIKRLDIFIVKSFLLLFVGAFFICLFIFMMQFLWKYVDELVGKGLEIGVLAQFFFYSALSLIPMSLLLTVLLASLITFGNFGERFGLLAMKATGISLLKIMRPLIILVFAICYVSFYFQNVIGPRAQAKLGTLLISMKQKSPEIDIPEGVFYDEIDGYNLKMQRRDRKTGMLYDVITYDFSNNFDNARIIVADSGRLEMTADKQHLYLYLYSGKMFRNLEAQSMNSKNVPYRRESFRGRHAIIQSDSSFNMADIGTMSNQFTTKDMIKIQASIDPMTVLADSIDRQYYIEASKGSYCTAAGLTKEDTLKMEEMRIGDYNVDSLFKVTTLMNKQKIIASAVGRTENLSGDWGFRSFTMAQNDLNIRRYKIEWHRRITISLSCLLFFFIGAPLGSTICKGGLGMPAIVSVFTFIIYYIIDNTGYKVARDGKWIVWMGMWMSSAILTPLGYFLTYKSNKDSVVLNTDVYIAWFKRVSGVRSVRHLSKKEVIIHDPDCRRLPFDLDAPSEECKNYMEKNRLSKAPNYFSLWMTAGQDQEIVAINNRMESLVDEMSSTRSLILLQKLEKYPITPANAHVRPFRNYWLNMAVGTLMPIDLFFYFRIWAFRIRLNKDMERIIALDRDVELTIKDTNNKN